jgi:hypothetical protein
MIKVALDFAPGLHGHFLEYVCNRYIFKVPYSNNTIFQESGSAHPINIDLEYQKYKIVHCGHYSSFEHEYPVDTTNIIFVKHNPTLDLILLTNIFHRCHPDSIHTDSFNINDIKSLQIDLMFNSGSTATALRTNWHTKLTERHFEHPDKKCFTNLPTFDFDYTSFFSLDRFLLELKKVADFLNTTFVFDKMLVSLWQEFIDRNQGYQLFLHGNRVFNQIASGESFPIKSNWQLHAYLNYKISTIFKLYDHPDLFEAEQYPTDTKQIYKLIIDHIENYDKKFG